MGSTYQTFTKFNMTGFDEKSIFSCRATKKKQSLLSQSVQLYDDGLTFEHDVSE